MPTLPTDPLAVTSPCRPAASTRPPAVAPPPADAMPSLAWTVTWRISERSMTSPPCRSARPAQSCPPPRTESGSSWALAILTAHRGLQFASGLGRGAQAVRGSHRLVEMPFVSDASSL
jgi:hypothetical protein